MAMSTLALEVGDAGLTAVTADTVAAAEPGCAVVEGGRVIALGEAALRQCRLKPRSVHNRFWAELADTDLPGTGLTQADLAHAQLETLWARVGGGVDSVIMVVPGFYARDQLGLLLGLAQDVGLPVRGMVDAAVAASVQPIPERQRIHLDAGPHRFTATVVEHGERGARRGTVAELRDVGLDTLSDVWLRHVAQLFVSATRFDPLHDAATEQQLFDRLPQWLAEAERVAEVTLELPGRDGQPVQVRAPSAALLSVAGGTWRALAQLVADLREPGRDLVVQLDERLLLPGLRAALGALKGCHVLALPAGSAGHGALARERAMRHEHGAVVLTRQLPFAGEALTLDAVDQAGAPDHTPSPGAAGRASHVVFEGVAWPLTDRAIVVGTGAPEPPRGLPVPGDTAGVSRLHCELLMTPDGPMLRDTSRFGTWVNGLRAGDGTPLAPGDVVRVGTPGVELRLIRLAESDGQKA